MVLHRWRDVLPAVSAPFVVLAYAVPVSLAIPLAIVLVRRGDPSVPGFARANGRGRIVAVLGTVAAGLVLFVFAGNGNPRYEYVLLPLLAMAVGGVAAGRLTPGEATLARRGV